MIGSLNKDEELLKSKCLLYLDVFQVNLTHGHLVVVQERIQTSGKYFRMTALSSLNIFALVTCITNCNWILRESENGRVCASKTCWVKMGGEDVKFSSINGINLIVSYCYCGGNSVLENLL